MLGLVCALVSILFCEVMHTSHKLFGMFFPNRYLWVAVGAALVMGISLLLGTSRYNGAGSDVIAGPSRGRPCGGTGSSSSC